MIFSDWKGDWELQESGHWAWEPEKTDSEKPGGETEQSFTRGRWVCTKTQGGFQNFGSAEIRQDVASW